jgi:hypothetical protein
MLGKCLLNEQTKAWERRRRRMSSVSDRICRRLETEPEESCYAKVS